MNTSMMLSPLDKPGKPINFSVCDIESVGWIKFLTIGHYDGKIFTHFESLDTFLSFIFTHYHGTIFAHFGGIFDFLFILTAILESDRYSLFDLIPRGSGVLCFAVLENTTGRKIVFRDSSALFPFGLRKLTESFGVTHVKQEIDYAQIKEVTPQLIEYLEYDCKGLWESLNTFYSSVLISQAGPKTTIASQAVQVLRSFIQQPIPACPAHVDTFVRTAYAGGRTEIFRPLYVSKKQTLKCYDVNSLYPYVMQSNEFPTAFHGFSNTFDLERMGFCECTVEVPKNDYMPLLWSKKEKFLFPVGIFSGVWSTIEIKEAIKNGAKVLKTGQCCYFENGGPIFRDYINSLYKIRLESTSEVDKTIVKLLMNSTYGRMGLNPKKEGLELDRGQPDVTPAFELKIGKHTIRFVKTEVTLKSFSNVAIAAWVTALARIHMHRIMKPIEKSVYYMDTDSIYTPEILPNSKNLGDLKLEAEMNEACFLLPKTYFAGGKVSMKGFDKKKIQHFKFDDFCHALEGDLKMLKIPQDVKMMRMKTAGRHNTLLKLSKQSTRQIKSVYDKRVLTKTKNGWETSPIILKELEDNGRKKRTCA